ncbi:MAG TPA: 2-C-methyl-D-erythritol 2,4-cyclodiphosphate synthase [Cytophagales bacterium]|nr:2-C-methyl-D-erythritol 2,4-cyclodiphosphate synthase [Cytophagales bacterium]
MKVKVGFGYDIHQLQEGRALWLGGIKLDHYKGLLGHSDADVLIHAVCDALLGAANKRDIGYHFSNKDPRWKGIDSKILLREVTKIVKDAGYEIGNVDVTLSIEFPRINPHVEQMQVCLAECMGIDADDVSIKATTNEQLGYVGREEGVNAYAVALIYKN